MRKFTALGLILGMLSIPVLAQKKDRIQGIHLGQRTACDHASGQYDTHCGDFGIVSCRLQK